MSIQNICMPTRICLFRGIWTFYAKLRAETERPGSDFPATFFGEMRDGVAVITDEIVKGIEKES